MSRKIERVIAALAEEDGHEGIAAANLGGTFYPLVGGDPDREPQITEMAQMIADLTGRTIRIVEFTVRTEIAVLTPKPEEAGK